MPFTPLVPLPGSTGEEMLDPFEALLRPSAASTSSTSTSSSSSSKPIFSSQPSSARRPATPAQPIPIPVPTPSSSSTTMSSRNNNKDDGADTDGVNRGSNSANSDFGAFVSVDPSQDPLSAEFSPVAEFSAGANDAFVEEAKRRAEHGEKRIRDEFDLFELDPSSLITSVAATPPARPVVEESFFSSDASQQLSDFEEAFEDMDMFDPLRPSQPTQPKDSTTATPSTTSSSSIITSHTEDARSTTPTAMTSTPDVFHSSRTTTPTPEDSFPAHESESMSSSFTSYFSGTLPRKWSTLLRSPSSSALPVQHAHPSTHPAHTSTMPASIPVTKLS